MKTTVKKSRKSAVATLLQSSRLTEAEQEIINNIHEQERLRREARVKKSKNPFPTIEEAMAKAKAKVAKLSK